MAKEGKIPDEVDIELAVDADLNKKMEKGGCDPPRNNITVREAVDIRKKKDIGYNEEEHLN